VKLTKIIRQDMNSGIVINSHCVLSGEKFCLTNSDGAKFNDFFVIEEEDEQKSHDKIIFYVTEALKKKRGINSEEIQVLCPGKKGRVGVEILNKDLRDKLNPSEREMSGFRVNDKVINTKNNYKKEIVNGDTGYVAGIGRRGVEVKIDDGETVEFTENELMNLQLAYATTIHKAQGSEYRAVVYPVHNSHWILHSRNLMYTGITRAKEIVILIGSKKSINQSIKNNKPVKRMTRLKELLTS
ncbi:MAG: ATP-dependent DNA helicase, partial [Nitrososphaeraceae archaeon]